MAVLLRGAKVRLGLVTNGEHWTLVDALRDGTAGSPTWRAELWLDEPLTLRAFRALLVVVPDGTENPLLQGFGRGSWNLGKGTRKERSNG